MFKVLRASSVAVGSGTDGMMATATHGMESDRRALLERFRSLCAAFLAAQGVLTAALNLDWDVRPIPPRIVAVGDLHGDVRALGAIGARLRCCEPRPAADRAPDKPAAGHRPRFRSRGKSATQSNKSSVRNAARAPSRLPDRLQCSAGSDRGRPSRTFRGWAGDVPMS